MVGVVNLNRVRKARDRAEKRRKADANAAFHGLSKAQKELARARAEKAGREHSGKRRDDKNGDDPPDEPGGSA
ncbi:DUF4169 family protein [Citreimonas salinaria]|uniref:DUF4169 domain-containing protein n=1 Tax=Citreimonas salinaria TaxID=321339 RepID=A0A1H3GFF6_9RHOB|nr:DUF4169 family protein [Citreimonas salinaria]SDY01787.1 protein of unknown function [Citreimonas salinaria]